VKICEYWTNNHEFLKLFESLSTIFILIKLFVLFCKVDEGAYNIQIRGYKLSVKISKSNKGLQSFNVSWNSPIFNGVNFLGIYKNSFFRVNNIIEVFDFVGFEFIFLNISLKFCFNKLLQDILNLLAIIFEVFRKINQNVVGINSNKIIQNISQNPVDISLEN
jgi:hypothetical protein